MQVNRRRQQSLAFRWIIERRLQQQVGPGDAASVWPKEADGRRSAVEGEAMTKRENTIKMADSNKAFAHFAW